MLGLALTVALAGDCPEGDPVDRVNTHVEESLDAAEGMFARSVDRFGKLMVPVRATAGCLSEPIRPTIAARYHRLYALQRDPAGKFGLESELVAGSLRASRALDSTYEFPPELLAEDHALRAAYAKLPPDLPATERIPAPREGMLWFDGTATLDRPLEVATFYQRTDESGAVVESTYLGSGVPLPPYERDPVRRRRLTVSMITTGAVAAGLYTGALASEAQFKHRDADGLADLESMRTTNRALFVASVGFGVTAGGLGLAAYLVGPQ